MNIVGILASFAGVIVILLGFLDTYIQRYIQYDLEGFFGYLPESIQSWPVWLYGVILIGGGVLLMSIASVVGKHIGK